jgi:hypothetical protein
MRRTRFRVITTFCVAMLVTLVIGVPAAPAEDFTIDPAICGFPVSVDILRNKEKAITLSNGMTIVNGALRLRLTNVDDPAQSIVLNVPGPGFFDERGLIATGPWLFFFSPGEFGPGSPGILALFVGRSQVNENGLKLLAGRRVNLCQRLASE